jgi:6-phosphogluconolactonase
VRLGLSVWVGLLALGCASTQPAAAPKRLAVYLGTYTGEGSRGIYRSELDLETGTLAPPQLAGEIDNPSFLAIHPNGRFLYAVGEVSNFGGKRAGAVSAFAIDPASGKLTLLNQQSSEGSGPCHLSIPAAGTTALVANYGGGSVAALPIGADGKLGAAGSSVQHVGSSVNKSRQAGPHAHSINPSPDGRYALAADLGLDQVLVYRLDAAKATLAPHTPPHAPVTPGGGPRHLTFHPTGRFVYVNNEMLSSVTAFAYDPERATLKELQTLSTLPDGFGGNNSTAETQVTPDGRWVLVSNRGHDSIAVFAVDAATGRLTARGHASSGGKTPRNFGVDPTGRYVVAANQGSGTVVVLRLDPSTGALTPTGSSIQVARPVCVRFLPL